MSLIPTHCPASGAGQGALRAPWQTVRMLKLVAAGLGVVGLALALAPLLLQRGRGVGPQRLTAGALYLFLASVLLPQAFGSRTLTNLGVVTLPLSGRAALAARVLGYAGFALAGLSIMVRRRHQRASLWFVLGLYGLVLGSQIGGAWGANLGFDRYFLMYVVLIHSQALALAQDRGYLVHLRSALRVLIVGSLLLLLLRPSYAVLSAADSGRQILGVGRLTGLLPHPNLLGPIALLALVVELYVPGRKVWRVVSSLAALVCLILAQSAMALAAALLCVVLVVFTSRWTYKWPIRTLAALAVVAAFVLSIPAHLIHGVAGERVGTVSGRSVIWRYSWESFKKHPGVGLGNYFLGPEFRSATLPANQQQAVHAHNELFQVLGQSGLLGLVALLVLLGGALVVALRARSAGNMLPLLTWIALLGACVTEVPIRSAGASGIGGVLALGILGGHGALATEPGAFDFDGSTTARVGTSRFTPRRTAFADAT